MALKVCVQGGGDLAVLTEVAMLRHIAKNIREMPDHVGIPFTRTADDILEIDGPYGSHYCMAFKPQGTNLRFLQEVFPDAMVPKLLVKSLMHRLFVSLNFLHVKCGLIHTGKLNSPHL